MKRIIEQAINPQMKPPKNSAAFNSIISMGFSSNPTAQKNDVGLNLNRSGGRAGQGKEQEKPTPKTWALAYPPFPLKICSFPDQDSKRKLQYVEESQIYVQT